MVEEVIQKVDKMKPSALNAGFHDVTRVRCEVSGEGNQVFAQGAGSCGRDDDMVNQPLVAGLELFSQSDSRLVVSRWNSKPGYCASSK